MDAEFYGTSDAHKKAVEDATKYCNSHNKKLEVKKLLHNSSQSFSNATILFQCK